MPNPFLFDCLPRSTWQERHWLVWTGIKACNQYVVGMCFSAWSFLFKLLFSLLLICIFKGFIFSLIKSTLKTVKMRFGYTAETKHLSNTGFYLQFFVKWGLLLCFYLLRGQISWIKSRVLNILKIHVDSATYRWFYFFSRSSV